MRKKKKINKNSKNISGINFPKDFNRRRPAFDGRSWTDSTADRERTRRFPRPFCPYPRSRTRWPKPSSTRHDGHVGTYETVRKQTAAGLGEAVRKIFATPTTTIRTTRASRAFVMTFAIRIYPSVKYL